MDMPTTMLLLIVGVVAMIILVAVAANFFQVKIDVC